MLEPQFDSRLTFWQTYRLMMTAALAIGVPLGLLLTAVLLVMGWLL